MKLYGLIGYPLGHSFSKKYFTEKFEKEKLDCSYENYSIENITLLEKILQDNPGLLGLSVTIPYKEKVIPYLHEVAPDVAKIKACNSIRIRNGKLSGYNTDTIGFEQSLRIKLKPHHKSALILGTGGAARAVAWVLDKTGIPYTFVSRTPGEKAITYGDLDEKLIREHTLIVNASPVGMYPHSDKYPHIPYGGIGPHHFLFDLVYNPEKTIFLSRGEQRGADIQNGLDMLVNQAEASWKIWNEAG